MLNRTGLNREIGPIIIMQERIDQYKTPQEYLAHHGKWLVYAPEDSVLNLAASFLLQKLVENPIIDGAKYIPEPAFEVPEGHTLGLDYVFLVYCDDRERDEVKKIINQKLKVEMGNMYWKYDRHRCGAC